jgi:hypothetical protein
MQKISVLKLTEGITITVDDGQKLYNLIPSPEK